MSLVTSSRVVIVTFLACLAGELPAADTHTIEEWTNELASFISKDLRSALVNSSFYSDQLVGLDGDSVAHQISQYQAACLVGAYIRLARKHSIDLDDIFVAPQSGLIILDAFYDSELRDETADCARRAFIATGIKFDTERQD